MCKCVYFSWTSVRDIIRVYLRLRGLLRPLGNGDTLQNELIVRAWQTFSKKNPKKQKDQITNILGLGLPLHYLCVCLFYSPLHRQNRS